MNVGTTAGTVAAGDDSRIVNAATKAYVDSQIKERGEIYQGTNVNELVYPIGHIVIAFGGNRTDVADWVINRLNSNTTLHLINFSSVRFRSEYFTSTIYDFPDGLVSGTWKCIAQTNSISSTTTNVYQRVL